MCMATEIEVPFTDTELSADSDGVMNAGLLLVGMAVFFMFVPVARMVADRGLNVIGEALNPVMGGGGDSQTEADAESLLGVQY